MKNSEPTKEEIIKELQLLRENHSRLKLALETSNIGLWDLSLIDHTSQRSLAHDRIFGYREPLSTWTYQMFISHVLPDDREYVERQFQESLATLKEWNFDCRIRRIDGEIRWIHAKGDHVVNSEGFSVMLTGLVEDITERKLGEEAVMEKLALLRVAGQKVKLGGWSLTLADNHIYWSDTVAAIHGMPAGYSPTVVEGINFYAPEWHEKIVLVFTRCIHEGVPYSEEMEIINSAGERVWVRTIGEAVRNSMGRIYKIQGALQDITEQKKKR